MLRVRRRLLGRASNRQRRHRKRKANPDKQDGCTNSRQRRHGMPHASQRSDPARTFPLKDPALRPTSGGGAQLNRVEEFARKLSPLRTVAVRNATKRITDQRRTTLRNSLGENWEDARTLASEIKDQVLADLKGYLLKLE